MRFPPIIFVALLIGSSASCGESGRRGVVQSSTPVPICGEGGVGFVAETHAFGAMIDLGRSVALELGQFVAVDPSCRFVVTDPYDGSVGTALGGHLTSEQASTLAELLALEELDGLASEYAFRCGTDGAISRFAWGERRLSLTCSAPELAPDDVEDRLMGLTREVASLLKPWGEPVNGPLRYVLVDGGNDRVFDGAPEWPLDTSPDVLSEHVLPGDPGFFDPDVYLTLGEPRVWTASAEAADRLRSLRAAWLEGSSGQTARPFVPIEEANGSRFALYMRDVIEFEVDARTFVPWATDGSLVLEATAPPTTSDLRFEIACGTSDGTNEFEGRLEPFSDQPDNTYWRGRVDGLPPGDCNVRLIPTDPDDALRCGAYRASVTIPLGWSASQCFRCPPTR